MNEQLKNKILDGLKAQENVGFYYKNLVTGETMGYRENEVYSAASTIKLPMFMCIVKWESEGLFDFSERIKIKNEYKVPVCGALTLFTDEPEVDIKTLCNLMISLSDNTASNVLMTRFGFDAYAKEFANLGLKKTQLQRHFFDPEASKQGKKNVIVPAELGHLLEMIANRTFVSKEACEYIESILLQQQVTHKMQGILGEDAPIAHKTGEADDITHDVGICYAKQPFIACFNADGTNVPVFEDFIRHTTKELWDENNK